MFIDALAKEYRDKGVLKAFCDTNHTRMEYYNRQIQKTGHPLVQTYDAVDFDKMIAEQKPDYVIVTSMWNRGKQVNEDRSAGKCRISCKILGFSKSVFLNYKSRNSFKVFHVSGQQWLAMRFCKNTYEQIHGRDSETILSN